jgi:hypothetical protein
VPSLGASKLYEAIASTQLSELNQRVRMHATRLWQLPFAYFSLVVFLLSNANSLKGDMSVMVIVFLLTVGTIVLWCMLGAYEGVCRGSQEIGKLEERMGLRKTAGVQPDWLEAFAMNFFKRLTWHFLPYFLLALVSLAAVFSLPFLQKDGKAEAAAAKQAPVSAAPAASALSAVVVPPPAAASTLQREGAASAGIH